MISQFPPVINHQGFKKHGSFWPVKINNVACRCQWTKQNLNTAFGATLYEFAPYEMCDWSLNSMHMVLLGSIEYAI